MNILRVTTSLDFGGVEKHLETIGEYSINSKLKFGFIALGGGGTAERKLKSLGFDVICLNQSVKIPNLKLIFILAKIFKEKKPDVIHTSAGEANFHGIIAGYLAKVPVIIGEEIGMPNHSKKAQLVFRMVYKLAHSVIGVSKATTNFLKETNEVPENKLKVIYNPVSINEDTFEDVPKRNFTIVSVCRLIEIKNLKSLILALKYLRDNGENVDLWLVGDGDMLQELKQLTHDNNPEDAVTFWGFQSEPIKYLKSSNLFVLPSFSEGTSIALIEAMLVGLPTIATKIGGSPEIIDENVTGWLIDPYNLDEIKDKLLNVVRLSKDKLVSIGIQAQKVAREKYNPLLHLHQLEVHYKSLHQPVENED